MNANNAQKPDPDYDYLIRTDGRLRELIDRLTNRVNKLEEAIKPDLGVQMEQYTALYNQVDILNNRLSTLESNYQRAKKTINANQISGLPTYMSVISMVACKGKVFIAIDTPRNGQHIYMIEPEANSAIPLSIKQEA